MGRTILVLTGLRQVGRFPYAVRLEQSDLIVPLLTTHPLEIRICCTIIAPSFLAAGLFFVLGVVINRLGPQYATFSPKAFSITFILCDLISLVVQAVGGAQASISFKTGGDPEKGAKIMVGGIIFQICE